jgi:hypothetical protein
MLSISTLDEAVAYLTRETGQGWSPSRLFDLTVANQISLLAVVPVGITTVTVRANSATSGRLEDIQDHLFALLRPAHVRQVWLRGEVETTLAADVDGVLGEYSQLSRPVRVMAKDVLVPAAVLEHLLKVVSGSGENVAGGSAEAAVGTVPVPRSEAQRLALLGEIERLGLRPTALPRNIHGHPGIKAKLKGQCLQQPHIFQSVWVFEHTWSGMRALREIAYDDEAP